MKFNDYLEAAKIKPDYNETAYKIDKWMPSDEDIQNEYWKIKEKGSVEDMIGFLENNADLDALFHHYMPKGGTIMGLAKYIMGKK